jgi:hypothetical protein
MIRWHLENLFYISSSASQMSSFSATDHSTVHKYASSQNRAEDIAKFSIRQFPRPMRGDVHPALNLRIPSWDLPAVGFGRNIAVDMNSVKSSIFFVQWRFALPCLPLARGDHSEYVRKKFTARSDKLFKDKSWSCLTPQWTTSSAPTRAPGSLLTTRTQSPTVRRDQGRRLDFCPRHCTDAEQAFAAVCSSSVFAS